MMRQGTSTTRPWQQLFGRGHVRVLLVGVFRHDLIEVHESSGNTASPGDCR